MAGNRPLHDYDPVRSEMRGQQLKQARQVTAQNEINLERAPLQTRSMELGNEINQFNLDEAKSRKADRELLEKFTAGSTSSRGYDIDANIALLYRAGKGEAARLLEDMKSKRITNQQEQQITRLKIAKALGEGTLALAEGPNTEMTVAAYQSTVRALRDAGLVGQDTPDQFQGEESLKALRRLVHGSGEALDYYDAQVNAQGEYVQFPKQGGPARNTGVQAPPEKGDEDLGVPNNIQNTIMRTVAQSKGGLYDPRSGMITGLSEVEYSKALNVTAEANQIWMEHKQAGQPISGAEAVRMAERSTGGAQVPETPRERNERVQRGNNPRTQGTDQANKAMGDPDGLRNYLSQ